MDHNDDILDGLDDILGATGEDLEPSLKSREVAPAPPSFTRRIRRTKAEMTAAAAAATGRDPSSAGALAASALAAAPVTPPSVATVVPAAPTDPMAAQHGFSGRKLKIIIDKGHGKDDPTSVFLRLNNYEAAVLRGVPVELYEEVVAACLDYAVQTVFAQPQDGVLIPHDSLRFSYRVVR